MSPTASLTMYAWPEVQASLDQFWRLFQQQLVGNGYKLPANLDHDMSEDIWHDSQLGLSQTCGYPLNHVLGDSVSLLGTPGYLCDFVSDGLYASVILARRSDSREQLLEFQHTTVAINSLISQSGFNALRNLLVERNLISATSAAFFAKATMSHSHRQSIKTVASGLADICAVDPVSYAFAQQYEPAVEALKVIDCTASTPGLPLICSSSLFQGDGDKFTAYKQAVRQAWQHAAADPVSAPLLLGDVVDIPRAAYSAVASHEISLFKQAS